ncbi:DUF2567 domain-containing protein [Gordonia soli]|uniref:DUF2567 domain-containing protein n=1 Tax=Gordonia soli NBRC 108243 TaxID=1223545 RepID=M0QNK7_9ACTN|nr:DUF2567 domain-containing protein [Gordonia soli]GAC69989.1 hypothetical protein GS4_30_00610 [Gordonia soli NBRC 108243]
MSSGGDEQRDPTTTGPSAEPHPGFADAGFAGAGTPAGPSIATDTHRGRSLAAIVGVTLLASVVLGLVWAWVTPTMSGRVVSADAAIIPGDQAGEEFGGVAVFLILQFAFGVLVTLLAWFVARNRRGPLGFGVLAVASILGSGLAAWIGTLVADWRFDDPRTLPVGARFSVTPDLWLEGAIRDGAAQPWVILVGAPIAVALTYLLLALLSRDADLGVGDLRRTPPPSPPGAPVVATG